MNRILALLVVVAAVVALTLRADSVLPAEEAQAYLKAGALLVDVRTPEEFAAKRLPGAVNIPLNTIQIGITNCAADKSRVILVHCRSGRRSGIAKKELRALGYTNAFNIGSFEQAASIVGVKAAD